MDTQILDELGKEVYRLRAVNKQLLEAAESARDLLSIIATLPIENSDIPSHVTQAIFDSLEVAGPKLDAAIEVATS